MADPNTIANLELWLRPEELEADYSDKDPISQWRDASGNDRHFGNWTQDGAPAARPVFRSGLLEGKGGAVFEGDGLFNDSSALKLDPRTQAFTIYTVFRVPFPFPNELRQVMDGTVSTGNQTQMYSMLDSIGDAENFFPVLFWPRGVHGEAHPGYALYAAHGIPFFHGFNTVALAGESAKPAYGTGIASGFWLVMEWRTPSLPNVALRHGVLRTDWRVSGTSPWRGPMSGSKSGDTGGGALASDFPVMIGNPLKLGGPSLKSFWDLVGTPNRCSAEVAEVIVYSSSLGDSDRESVHDYLVGKYVPESSAAGGSYDPSQETEGIVSSDWYPMWDKSVAALPSSGGPLVLNNDSPELHDGISLFRIFSDERHGDLSVYARLEPTKLSSSILLLAARVWRRDDDLEHIPGALDEFFFSDETKRNGVFLKVSHSLSGSKLRISQRKDDEAEEVVGSADVDWESSVEHHVLFALDGAQAKAKIWRKNDPEPSSWTVEASVAHENPGFFGTGAWDKAGIKVHDMNWRPGTSELASPPDLPPGKPDQFYPVRVGEIFASKPAQVIYLWEPVPGADEYEFQWRRKGGAEVVDITGIDTPFSLSGANHLVPDGWFGVFLSTDALEPAARYEGRVRALSTATGLFGDWSRWREVATPAPVEQLPWSYDRPEPVSKGLKTLLPKSFR